MTPTLTFFNNKGGVGKTSTVYHLAWMLAELGHRVVVCDLDPQASLTTSFLWESELEELWNEGEPSEGSTIYSCVQPLAEGVNPFAEGVDSAAQRVDPTAQRVDPPGHRVSVLATQFPAGHRAVHRLGQAAA